MLHRYTLQYRTLEHSNCVFCARAILSLVTMSQPHTNYPSFAYIYIYIYMGCGWCFPFHNFRNYSFLSLSVDVCVCVVCVGWAIFRPVRKRQLEMKGTPLPQRRIGCKERRKTADIYIYIYSFRCIRVTQQLSGGESREWMGGEMQEKRRRKRRRTGWKQLQKKKHKETVTLVVKWLVKCYACWILLFQIQLCMSVFVGRFQSFGTAASKQSYSNNDGGGGGGSNDNRAKVEKR